MADIAEAGMPATDSYEENKNALDTEKLNSIEEDAKLATRLAQEEQSKIVQHRSRSGRMSNRVVLEESDAEDLVPFLKNKRKRGKQDEDYLEDKGESSDESHLSIDEEDISPIKPKKKQKPSKTSSDITKKSGKASGRTSGKAKSSGKVSGFVNNDVTSSRKQKASGTGKQFKPSGNAAVRQPADQSAQLVATTITHSLADVRPTAVTNIAEGGSNADAANPCEPPSLATGNDNPSASTAMNVTHKDEHDVAASNLADNADVQDHRNAVVQHAVCQLETEQVPNPAKKSSKASGHGSKEALDGVKKIKSSGKASGRKSGSSKKSGSTMGCEPSNPAAALDVSPPAQHQTIANRDGATSLPDISGLPDSSRLSASQQQHLPFPETMQKASTGSHSALHQLTNTMNKGRTMLPNKPSNSIPKADTTVVAKSRTSGGGPASGGGGPSSGPGLAGGMFAASMTGATSVRYRVAGLRRPGMGLTRKG